MLIEFANHAKKRILDVRKLWSAERAIKTTFHGKTSSKKVFYIFKTNENKKNLNFKIIFNKLNNIKYSYQVDFFFIPVRFNIIQRIF